VLATESHRSDSPSNGLCLDILLLGSRVGHQIDRAPRLLARRKSCSCPPRIGRVRGAAARWASVPGSEHHSETWASSRKRQNALASCIWRGVRHCASKTDGEATSRHRHLAREVATLSLCLAEGKQRSKRRARLTQSGRSDACAPRPPTRRCRGGQTLKLFVSMAAAISACV